MQVAAAGATQNKKGDENRYAAADRRIQRIAQDSQEYIPVEILYATRIFFAHGQTFLWTLLKMALPAAAFALQTVHCRALDVPLSATGAKKKRTGTAAPSGSPDKEPPMKGPL